MYWTCRCETGHERDRLSTFVHGVVCLLCVLLCVDLICLCLRICLFHRSARRLPGIVL